MLFIIKGRLARGVAFSAISLMSIEVPAHWESHRWSCLRSPFSVVIWRGRWRLKQPLRRIKMSGSGVRSTMTAPHASFPAGGDETRVRGCENLHTDQARGT